MWRSGARPRLARTRACLLGAALPWLAACGDLADRGLAARADDWTLTEERLAELLVLAQPFPLDSVAVHELAIHWVGAAALSLRAAAGDSLLGSEAVEASMWIDRREALLAADREARLGARVMLDGATIEAVFRAGSVRLFAHVLRRVGPEASSNERLLQQRTAERLLGTLAEGGSWAQVVAESEDAVSKQSGGVLGLFGRGELPSTLDRVAFRLDPGQVSGITQSNQGYHILYRPRLEEVSSLFGAHLRQRRLDEADAASVEETRAARGFSVAPGAVAVLGRLVLNPGEWLESERPLATWEGGSLTAGVAARYVMFLPARSRPGVAAGDIDTRTALIEDLGMRELRIADAVERGLSLDPSLEESYFRAHAEEIEYWTLAVELDEGEAASREALARHMERVVSRSEEARSLPPLFEAWLLRQVDARVRERGVLAAIVVARGMLP